VIVAVEEVRSEEVGPERIVGAVVSSPERVVKVWVVELVVVARFPFSSLDFTWK
jgi:hypothetical protein